MKKFFLDISKGNDPNLLRYLLDELFVTNNFTLRKSERIPNNPYSESFTTFYLSMTSPSMREYEEDIVRLKNRQGDKVFELNKKFIKQIDRIVNSFRDICEIIEGNILKVYSYFPKPGLPEDSPLFELSIKKEGIEVIYYYDKDDIIHQSNITLSNKIYLSDYISIHKNRTIKRLSSYIVNNYQRVVNPSHSFNHLENKFIKENKRILTDLIADDIYIEKDNPDYIHFHINKNIRNAAEIGETIKDLNKLKILFILRDKMMEKANDNRN